MIVFGYQNMLETPPLTRGPYGTEKAWSWEGKQIYQFVKCLDCVKYLMVNNLYKMNL